MARTTQTHKKVDSSSAWTVTDGHEGMWQKKSSSVYLNPQTATNSQSNEQTSASQKKVKKNTVN